MISFRMVCVIAIASLGSFQFGYNTGVINAPADTIKEVFLNGTSDVTIPKDDIVIAWAFVVSVFLIGGMCGSLLVGHLADLLGRRLFMFVLAIFGVIAGVILDLSKLATSYFMLIFGRILVGFVCGAYTGLVPMYLSEVAPLNVRGAIGILNQLAIVTGILVSQILGLSFILGNEFWWQILFGLTALPALIQAIFVLFVCPESPRYLLITKDDESSARRSLKSLGVAETEEDLAAMVDEMKKEAEQHSREESVSILRLFGQKDLRWPLCIAVIMQLSQQLSGINGICYYSSTFFKESANLLPQEAEIATLSVGIVLVVTTAISVPLIDILGRKVLHSVGLGGMLCASISVVVFLSLSESWSGYVGVTFCLVFVLFFSIGPGSVPWLITPELFAQPARPSATAIATLINWSANLAVGLAFGPLQDVIKHYVFVIFAVFLLGFLIFTLKFVPETKGKTFKDIAAEFATSSALTRKEQGYAPVKTGPVSIEMIEQDKKE